MQHRNREKPRAINNIKPIVPPTPKKNKEHPQRSHQFCYGEKFLWLGVPQQTDLTPKEDPTTLTTHPATSHNIKLTKREDVRDCIKNSCVCTRLLAKNTRMYMTVVQKPVYTEKAVVKSRSRPNQ